MTRSVLIEGILLLLVGAVAAGEGVRVTIYKDPYTLYDPLGPGLYILVFGLAMMITAVVHLATHAKTGRPVEPVAAGKLFPMHLAGTIGILALYIFLIGVLGYFVASLVFFVPQFKIAGVKSWLTALALSVVLSVSFYFIFVKFGGMVFPKGVLFS